MNGKRRRPGPALAALLLGAGALAAAAYFKPMPALEDRALLVSDAAVRVEPGTAGLAFVPTLSSTSARPKSTGLVFYCGARIPPEAYAYLARACAEAGYTAVLAAMPLNFAILAPSRALRAAAAYPGVARWVIAGHSLGGAAAAVFAAGKAGRSVAGLLLLASYPGMGADLSTKSLPVVTVSASRDGLATSARIAAAGSRLPAGSRYVEISGGNHAQFGEYGTQRGDDLAEIPETTQRKAVVDEALGLLDRIESLAGQ